MEQKCYNTDETETLRKLTEPGKADSLGLSWPVTCLLPFYKSKRSVMFPKTGVPVFTRETTATRRKDSLRSDTYHLLPLGKLVIFTNTKDKNILNIHLKLRTKFYFFLKHTLERLLLHPNNRKSWIIYKL